MTAPVPALRRLLDHCAVMADQGYLGISSDTVLTANAELETILDAAETLANATLTSWRHPS